MHLLATRAHGQELSLHRIQVQHALLVTGSVGVHQLLSLQLAGFVVNMDTRQQVQKLQQEVMKCTHELSTLQDHLKAGFAEVKDKIDDSQDRCPPFHVAVIFPCCVVAYKSTLCLVTTAADKGSLSWLATIRDLFMVLVSAVAVSLLPQQSVQGFCSLHSKAGL